MNALIVGFNNLATALAVTGVFNKSSQLRATAMIFGAAAGPVILVDGVPKKTVPDDILPDNLLIAPKRARKIKPGQTVTIQVQFPDGSTTNSISYTRPAG